MARTPPTENIPPLRLRRRPWASRGESANVASPASSPPVATVSQAVASRWATLTDDQRKKALRNIVNEMLRQYGMDPIQVVVRPMDAHIGGLFEPGLVGPPRISTNEAFLANASILVLAAHEARHAVQNHFADQVTLLGALSRRLSGQAEPVWPQHGISREAASVWDHNRGLFGYHNIPDPKHYNPNDANDLKKYTEAFDRYRNQAIEADSALAEQRLAASMTEQRLMGSVNQPDPPPPPPTPPPTPYPSPPPAPTPTPSAHPGVFVKDPTPQPPPTPLSDD
jgi:hypothetical protein